MLVCLLLFLLPHCFSGIFYNHLRINHLHLNYCLKVSFWRKQPHSGAQVYYEGQPRTMWGHPLWGSVNRTQLHFVTSANNNVLGKACPGLPPPCDHGVLGTQAEQFLSHCSSHLGMGIPMPAAPVAFTSLPTSALQLPTTAKGFDLLFCSWSWPAPFGPMNSR